MLKKQAHAKGKDAAGEGHIGPTSLARCGSAAGLARASVSAGENTESARNPESSPVDGAGVVSIYAI